MTSMSMEHHIHAPTGQGTRKPGIEAPLMTGRKQTVSPPLPVEGLATESITSVPNPFAAVSQPQQQHQQPAGGAVMPNAVSDGSMTSINWATASTGDPQTSTVASSVPLNNSPSGGNRVMLAASGIRVPTTSSGGSSQGPTQQAAKKKTSPQKKEPSPVSNRRQKRLERNRESARLSRRRRKQYLEVLEDRVNQLSLEMDKGRRQHVAAAMSTLQSERQQAMQSSDLAALETILSRSSDELRVAGTFLSQQLQSLVFPPHSKFLLWLTLQSDTYFRGGRAASERLSAARIGERMLSSGNDRVSPAHGMWPLFCNDVGLSYDQEERIRCAQRVLVQTPETWLDRHTGTASGLAMQSAHDCMQALSNCVEEKDRSIMNVLSDEQRIKFLQWAANNKHRLAVLKRSNAEPQDGFAVSPTNHEAANLYIINHRLQKALNKLAPPPALVVGSAVKRLSRRPSFETLGSSEASRKDESRALSREGSFASSGSLKRSASDMSMDIDKGHGQSVSPDAAEVAAEPTIDATLGFVKGIMPLRPLPQPEPVSSFKMPPPKSAPVVSHPPVTSSNHYDSVRQQQVVPQQPVVPQTIVSAPPAFQPPAPATQQPTSSFLPQPLNAVPEEDGGFLGQQGIDPADDFLFELAAGGDDDWAIGEGFEMDTNP